MTVPEGGWGWLVVIASALSKMVYWGTIPSFAIIYSDIISTNPGYEGSSVTNVLGSFSVFLSITGIMTPALYHFGMTFRQVGFAGGIVYLSGSLMSIFVTSVPLLIFSYGVIQGFGFGLMLSATLASFNLHFRRRRTMAMAVVQFLNAVGAVALPMMSQTIIDAYGPRACRGVVAALSLVTALFQLVLRKPPLTTMEKEDKLEPCGTPVEQIENCKEKIFKEQGVNESDDESNGCLAPTTVGQTHHERDKHKWRASLLQHWRRFWKLTQLEFPLLRDLRLTGSLLSLGIIDMANPALFAMLPLHLRVLNVSEANVNLVVTTACIGDLVGRLFLILIGHKLSEKNRLTFAVGALVTVVGIIVLSFVEMLEIIFALAAIVGLCKASIYVTFFMTIAEVVPPEKFSASVAFYFPCQMFAALTVNPIIGLTRDFTESYKSCFWVIAAFTAICPILLGSGAAITHLRSQGSTTKVPKNPSLSSRTTQSLVVTAQTVNTKGEQETFIT